MGSIHADICAQSCDQLIMASLLYAHIEGWTNHPGHGEQRFLYNGVHQEDLPKNVTINPWDPGVDVITLDPASVRQRSTQDALNAGCAQRGVRAPRVESLIIFLMLAHTLY